MRISPVLLSLVFSSSLAIAAPPVAVEDAYSLSEDAPLTKSGTDGMRSNDNAGAAADPVVGLVTSPLHGVLTLSPDGGFTYVPTTNFNGSDSFLYKVFGDRAASAFTIDENASSLKIGATLRITFQGIPSISSDSSTSKVKGTLAAAIAPNAAPFSVIRITDLDARLSDAVSLKLGVGCIPILNTCVGAVQFDSDPDAITLRMDSAGPTTTVRSNGGFDADGSIFSVSGDGRIKGTEQLEPVFPPTPLPLALPAIPMPFNGKVSVSGGVARVELQVNYKGTLAVDASTSLSFSLSGVIKANADAPLPAVEESPSAPVSLTILPVNDAPVAGPDAYLVKAGTTLAVSASGQLTAEELIPAGSVWKYHHNGTDLGSTWKSWNFNDAGWVGGQAELGYGDSGILGGNRAEKTNIKGAAARPTAYFRREFNVTGINATRSLTFDLLRDDGAAVYLNGIEVGRQNLAPAADYATLAASRIPNADETRFFPETVPPGLLLEGKNVVAVEVHQFSTSDYYSVGQIDPADVSFDFKLRRESGLTGLLVNDADIDSPAMTVAVHAPPAHGTLTIQPDGGFDYTPDQGFSGEDSFLYRLSDGGTEDAEVRLISPGATWKYLDDDNDPGTAWKEPGYADSGWASGAAEIGYGDDNSIDDRPEATKLSYLLGNPPVTTYFRKRFTLPLPKAMLKSLKLRVLRDDGVAVYLNGVEIARDNLPSGAGHDTGATLPIEGELEARFNEFTVPAVGLAALVEGTNVLAVELHQNAWVSNDASFDCELIATALPGGKVTLNVTADDFDHDLMADAWERSHQLDFAVANGDEDDDRDGFSNRAEFLADTDPHDAASHLRIASASREGNEAVLRLPASLARRYVLQTSPDLTAWTDAGLPVTPAGPSLEFRTSLPVQGAPVFYRVRVDFQFP